MEQFEDPLRRELERFTVDDEIELFTIDATAIGGGVYPFTPPRFPRVTG